VRGSKAAELQTLFAANRQLFKAYVARATRSSVELQDATGRVEVPAWLDDTPKVSRISRETVKSRCAREWGGWGRLSQDGSGQHNPDRSVGPWGRAVYPLARRCLSAHHP
jgi:hypothetical protein